MIQKRAHGFTYLELIMAITLLAVLAAVTTPASQKIVKRHKELELKRNLRQMREAIDRFKVAHDQGLIRTSAIEQLGYPADFEELVEGVPLTEAKGGQMRFLRRIPRDPMTGEASWGMRSVQDDPDAASWGRENLFDVYSLSDGVGLDGTEYSTW